LSKPCVAALPASFKEICTSPSAPNRRRARAQEPTGLLAS
jgi:hypothetical protein